MIDYNEKIVVAVVEARKEVPNFELKNNNLFDLGGMNFEQIKFIFSFILYFFSYFFGCCI